MGGAVLQHERLRGVLDQGLQTKGVGVSNRWNCLKGTDVVMGGKSSGSFALSPEGHGVFKGAVSLENNGGFSSLRYNCEKTTVKK